jgi:hypothetical protein
MSDQVDFLTLKWGNLKAWNLRSEAALAAMGNFVATHPSVGAMARLNNDQKVALCNVVDACNCETVYLDWDGKDVSKDEAKRYIMEYGVS